MEKMGVELSLKLLYNNIVLKSYLILELKIQLHLYNFICEYWNVFYQHSCEYEKN